MYALNNPLSYTDPSGRDPWWTDPNDRSSVCAFDPMGLYTRNDCTDRSCRFNTSLDPAYECPSAWDDPTIGFMALLCPLVFSALMPEVIMPIAEGAGTAACADGDCTNEAGSILDIIGRTYDKLGTVINRGTGIGELPSTIDPHAVRRLTDHGISLETIELWQQFDTVVLSQSNGAKSLFITPQGAWVIDKAGTLVTAYPQQTYKGADLLRLLSDVGWLK